ncbi:hypothetical protein M8J77_004661 [Diaphorina citri]|nr:hypothetical protein M8J77_003024 [Diaphorina citri]KAI5724594.1 hypothetical protein M8J77_004661 [Diaphorina citri]
MDQFNKPCALLMTGNVAQNFKDFVRDVKIYFTATETDKKPDVVQVARLKNLMGVEALNQYSARATVEEGQETMEDVINVLSEICLPKKNEIWDVYQFFDRKQQSGETFDSFYSELRRRVKCCSFDVQEEKLLKVQIVLGVNSKNVQQRLLREDMSLDKMVNYCKSVENAEKKAQVLNSSVPVNYLSSGGGVKPPTSRSYEDSIKPSTSRGCEDSIKPSTSRGCEDSRVSPPRSPQGYGRQFRSRFDGRCEKCGWFHGGNVVCPARNRQCNACGERGHFFKVCDKVLLNREVNAMDNHESSDDEYYVLNVDTVNINKVSVSSVSQEMQDIPFYKVGIEIVHWAGTDYLVLIDYYSRWIEIRKMLTKRSSEIISCLKRIFCVHGIPAEVICDRYFFLSYEIRQFANEWNFNITSELSCGRFTVVSFPVIVLEKPQN